jgi:hypothetical protein
VKMSKLAGWMGHGLVPVNGFDESLSLQLNCKLPFPLYINRTLCMFGPEELKTIRLPNFILERIGPIVACRKDL